MSESGATSDPVIGPPPTLCFAKRSMGVGRMVKQEHAGGRDVAPIGAGLRVPRALPVGLHMTQATHTDALCTCKPSASGLVCRLLLVPCRYSYA